MKEHIGAGTIQTKLLYKERYLFESQDFLVAKSNRYGLRKWSKWGLGKKWIEHQHKFLFVINMKRDFSTNKFLKIQD